MARARNIKPGFFLNEELVKLSFETRLLFIGLWTLADREGRLEDREMKIKMSIFPADNINVGVCLNDLAISEFITRYSVNGKKYMQINNFKKHQNPHQREIDSEIPSPDDAEAQPRHTPSTTQVVTRHSLDSLVTDSPSLVTDSPINPLSDKSDGVRLANGKHKFKNDAMSILTFLNEKTGKHYRPLKANLEFIAGRLAEGATISDCRAVIIRQARKWDGTENAVYLRPATLFNASKFAQYTGEIDND